MEVKQITTPGDKIVTINTIPEGCRPHSAGVHLFPEHGTLSPPLGTVSLNAPLLLESREPTPSKSVSKRHRGDHLWLRFLTSNILLHE